MDIVVPVKLVPDLVEELELLDDESGLDPDAIELKLNEFDEHAIEEALLLKEAKGGTVTVIALDGESAEDALFSGIAKGADRAIRVTGGPEEGADSRLAARLFASVLKDQEFDLIFTGVQAADDRIGQLGPLLAQELDLPHVSVVTGVEVEGSAAVVNQEYAGGVMGRFEADMPVVLGIQAARQAPRYVPISKLRQVMKTATLEEAEGSAGEGIASAQVKRMFKPEGGRSAEMLEGEPEDVAEKIYGILDEQGVLKG
jgi:electron transfer flavoprotein beta subunit